MRNIAIIGAGQAGLLTAHDLLRHGYKVTLFSDKTAEEFLTRARPTGTAARFNMALDYERELGLNYWEDEAPKGEGVHLTFSPTKGNRLLTLVGRFHNYFHAIDLRLQSHRWMLELGKKGGKIEIETVSLERLEEIADAHDLTIVAAGRGDIRSIFPRDEARSVYDRPQRKLCMICTKGQPFAFEGCDLLPVKFNFFAPYGEAFWVPWFHKDVGPSWSMLFEAKEGGPMDRFDDVATGEQAVDRGREVIRDLMPWDYEWCKDMELLDENAWLKGGVTPEVRKVVGTLPSGKKVMSVGDTTMALDPIGGQGANNGNKMARNLVECIVERGEQPYDVDWMNETFERFWERHHLINTFNNALLEPITNPGKELLIAQYGSTGSTVDEPGPQRIANLFVENFDDPASFSEAFFDMKTARAAIEKATGQPAWRSALRGRLAIAKGQIRQKLGKPPGHPGTAG
jgi:hypothetical protein